MRLRREKRRRRALRGARSPESRDELVALVASSRELSPEARHGTVLVAHGVVYAYVHTVLLQPSLLHPPVCPL